MNNRTCPNCNYKYALTEYLKTPFFKGIFSTWNCRHCGVKLTVEESRRWLLAFLGLIPAVGLPHLADWFADQGLSVYIAWISAILLLVSFVILVFSFDKFCLVKEEKAPAKRA